MNPLSLFKKHQPFNAIVEGSMCDIPTISFYRVGYLAVPADVGVLLSPHNVYRYSVYSRPNIQPGEQQGLEELAVSSLREFGIGLKTEGEHTPPYLHAVRAVFLQDGRIYVEEQQRNKEWYRKGFRELCDIAKGIFADPDFQKGYALCTNPWRKLIGLHTEFG